MAIFKCKICGGTLEIKDGATVATCEYCGTKQTLPRLDDEKKANLYDRANHFRRNNEYDKAMGIYEQILTEDNTDAEAYWSLVLCKYGIEYVEDPSTHKRVPTVNRAQYTSIFDDDNYKSALQYADGYQKDVYVQEANAINEIQKGILEISNKEEPFDVFICYKETDTSGRRTPDSVLATELYHELTREGFKVFFSRITLEDKLGTAYEPYIFAALNSAKVMVVLGTKAEYFNAVWVKNEWSRYLSLIKQGERKMLIPAYKDMDPYDLPEEFSHLQAQDMSKLGFMQDLVRGINKIVSDKKDNAKETVIINTGNAEVEPLLKRAFIFLEDGKWQEADEYCERVLDIDPENSMAYLGKLMAELKVYRQDDLARLENQFDENDNYIKAIRYANKDLSDKLKSYIDTIRNTNDEKMYQLSLDLMKSAKTEEDFNGIAESFDLLKDYKDSKFLATECRDKADSARKDLVLEQAKDKMSGDSIQDCEKAIECLECISGWKDADETIVVCKNKIEELKAKAEIKRKEKEQLNKKTKKIFIIILILICIIIFALIILFIVIIPNNKYNNAVAVMNSGNYNEAITEFEALNGYKDSENMIENCYVEKFGKETWNKLKNLEVGDTYTLGTYEQDNNVANGKENIEWIVLDKNGKSLLLISKYALDCKPYNTSYADVTWESCTLRKWLNSDFINSAFSDDEKEMIPTVTLSSDGNPSNSEVSSGNETQDKVFLLSASEIKEYFTYEDSDCYDYYDAGCKATDYAVANGVDVSKGINYECEWWLRTPGYIQYYGHSYGHYIQSYAAHIGLHSYHRYCYIDDLGNVVSNSHTGIRPAIWISLG